MQPFVSPKIELSDQRQERVDVRVLPVIFRVEKPEDMNCIRVSWWMFISVNELWPENSHFTRREDHSLCAVVLCAACNVGPSTRSRQFRSRPPIRKPERRRQGRGSPPSRVIGARQMVGAFDDPQLNALEEKLDIRIRILRQQRPSPGGPGHDPRSPRAVLPTVTGARPSQTTVSTVWQDARFISDFRCRSRRPGNPTLGTRAEHRRQRRCRTGQHRGSRECAPRGASRTRRRLLRAARPGRNEAAARFHRTAYRETRDLTRNLYKPGSATMKRWPRPKPNGRRRRRRIRTWAFCAPSMNTRSRC